MLHRLTAVAASVAMAVACAAGAQPIPAPRPAADTAWVSRSALYEVFVRDFSPTGDLAGVTRGLARIQATGANVVWLMPIFPVGIQNRKAPLGSGRSHGQHQGDQADDDCCYRANHVLPPGFPRRSWK